jgi:hypothetical protein
VQGKLGVVIREQHGDRGLKYLPCLLLLLLNSAM